MIKLTIPIGPNTIEVTGEHETEVIKKAAFWLSVPDKCGKCQSPLTFGYKNPQGKYNYYQLVCSGPVRHSVNLGEKMDSHDLYFDSKKPWENYFYNADDNIEGGYSRYPNAGSDVSRSTKPALTPEREKIIARIVLMADALAAKSFKHGVAVAELDNRTDEQLINIGKSVAEKCRIAEIKV